MSVRRATPPSAAFAHCRSARRAESSSCAACCVSRPSPSGSSLRLGSPAMNFSLVPRAAAASAGAPPWAPHRAMGQRAQQRRSSGWLEDDGTDPGCLAGQWATLATLTRARRRAVCQHRRPKELCTLRPKRATWRRWKVSWRKARSWPTVRMRCAQSFNGTCAPISPKHRFVSRKHLLYWVGFDGTQREHPYLAQ